MLTKQCISAQKNDKERKDRIDSFRAGQIKISKR